MIVHRLDMATSGCVIMARTEAALKDLNRQVDGLAHQDRLWCMLQLLVFDFMGYTAQETPHLLLHATRQSYKNQCRVLPTRG